MLTFLGASVISLISFCFWPDLSSSLDVSLLLVSDRKYLSVCFLNLLIYKRAVIVIYKIYCLLISCDGLPFCLVSVSATSSNRRCLVPRSLRCGFWDLAPWFLFSNILWSYIQNSYFVRLLLSEGIFIYKGMFTYQYLYLKPNGLFPKFAKLILVLKSIVFTVR